MANSNFASGFTGFLIGTVTGLAIAAAGAWVISECPIPFVEKVQKVTADVDAASQQNGMVDPNLGLKDQPDTIDSIIKGTAAPAAAPEQVPSEPAAPVQSEAGQIWVQVGAFKSKPAADDRNMDLAMSGIEAKVVRNGELWVLRCGPFKSRDAAQAFRKQLSADKIDSSIVVQK